MVLILLAGAALAAPALVLEVRSAEREIVLPMRDTTFAYSYRQSIYDVLVREELRVVGGGIRIERAVSSDRRALEYFRWPGEPAETNGLFHQPAPDNGTASLQIAVVSGGSQNLGTGMREIRLFDEFGDDPVTVQATYRPLIDWLRRALWP